jgi:hypothetical protein
VKKVQELALGAPGVQGESKKLEKNQHLSDEFYFIMEILN